MIWGSRLHNGKRGKDNLRGDMEVIRMSEQHRTATEYKEKYAGSYCDGDTDIAEEHEIVKEVCEELREE